MIIDGDDPVFLDTGDCFGEPRLVGDHLVSERGLSGLDVRIAVFCYIRLSGIIRISAALDGYIRVLYVWIAAAFVDIEGLTRHVCLAVGDFACAFSAGDADLSIVDSDLTAAAKDADTVRYVEFGGIDGDDIFPWGVKTAGNSVCIDNRAIEYGDVTLTVSADDYRIAFVSGFLGACVLWAAVAGYHCVVRS